MKIYLLHGWAIDADNHQKWQALQKELAKQGIESQFLPLPGLSEPMEQVWTLDNYLNWLDQELNKDKQVILLGHSFGGQIASRYAALHPQKLQKLILIAAAGIRNNRPWPWLKRHIFYLAAKIGKLFSQAQFLRQLIYKLARERDYFQAPDNMKQTMNNVINDQTLKDLPQIVCETLIIWGKNDQVTPLWMGHKMKQLITNSDLKIINQARHSPQFTHVPTVVKYIAEFVKA